MVQWLSNHLPMQGTQVQSGGRTKVPHAVGQVSSSREVCTSVTESAFSRISGLQQEKPVLNEKPLWHN